MAMTRGLLICLIMLSQMGLNVFAQDSREEQTQAFILGFMANYKNPMAYYPFRRDIFLPSLEEIDSLDRMMDQLSASHLSYHFLFLSKDDTLKREIFLDAKGQPLFKEGFGKGLSFGGDLNYFQKRQSKLLNSFPNLGKFLLYNERFRKSNQPQKH